MIFNLSSIILIFLRTHAEEMPTLEPCTCFMALQTAEQHFRFSLNCFLLVVILILCNGEPVEQLPHRLNIAQLLLTATVAAAAFAVAVAAAAAVGREGGHAEDSLKQAFRPSVPDPEHWITDPDRSGSGSESCSFRQWFSRCQQKIIFNSFLLLFTVCTFASVFKDEKSLRSHKLFEIKIFLNFFCFLLEGSVHSIMDPDDQKTYGC
jgi:hypothetical protein